MDTINPTEVEDYYRGTGIELIENITLPLSGSEPLQYDKTIFYYDRILAFTLHDPVNKSHWFLSLFDENDLGDEFYALNFSEEFYLQIAQHDLTSLYLNSDQDPGILSLFRCYRVYDEIISDWVWLSTAVSSDTLDSTTLPSGYIRASKLQS